MSIQLQQLHQTGSEGKNKPKEPKDPTLQATLEADPNPVNKDTDAGESGSNWLPRGSMHNNSGLVTGSSPYNIPASEAQTSKSASGPSYDGDLSDNAGASIGSLFKMLGGDHVARAYGDSLSGEGIHPALLYGGTGAALGAGGAALYNYFRPELAMTNAGRLGNFARNNRRVSPWRAAALGAGALGLGATLGSSYLKKYSSAFSVPAEGFQSGSGALDTIISRIRSDSGLNTQEKQGLISEVMNLTESQRSSLSRILATSVGAAGGYLIARYLLRLGKGGRIVAAIAGGALGSFATRDRPATDFMGNPMRAPGTDMYGQAHDFQFG